jgi:hypothetical protein
LLATALLNEYQNHSHYIKLHRITLYYIILHYITLHYSIHFFSIIFTSILIVESGKLCWYGDRLRSGRLGFNSWQRQKIFLFSTVSKPVLVTTQPLIQWVLGVKPPGLETDNSPPSRMVKLYLHSPICLYGMVLK